MSAIGSRTHKIGSIYSRVKNLLNTGVMEAKNKPLWYDIYEAFPPKREPVYIPDPIPDEHGLVFVEDNVKPILYKEDWARAALVRLYNDFNSAYDLRRDNVVRNKSERFIDTYKDLQRLYPELTKEEVFDKTEMEHKILGKDLDRDQAG